MLPSKIKFHSRIYSIHPFVIVLIIKLSQPGIHHPESPPIMLCGHGGHFLPQRLVVPYFWFVVVHRAMGAQYLAGLPNADLMLYIDIFDQFSLLSRP